MPFIKPVDSAAASFLTFHDPDTRYLLYLLFSPDFVVLLVIMDTIQIYALTAGGTLSIFVLVNLLCLLIPLITRVSIFVSKHFTYPYLRQHRTLGPWTRVLLRNDHENQVLGAPYPSPLIRYPECKRQWRIRSNHQFVGKTSFHSRSGSLRARPRSNERRLTGEESLPAAQRFRPLGRNDRDIMDL